MTIETPAGIETTGSTRTDVEQTDLDQFRFVRASQLRSDDLGIGQEGQR